MSIEAAGEYFAKVRRDLEALKKRRDQVQDTIDKAKKPGSGASDARIRNLNQTLAKHVADIRRAESELENSSKIYPAISKIEQVDRELESNYESYRNALARGENAGTFAKKIEDLFKQRGSLQISGINRFVGKAPVPSNWKTQAQPEVIPTQREEVITEPKPMVKKKAAPSKTVREMEDVPQWDQEEDVTALPEETEAETPGAPKKDRLSKILEKTEFWYDLPDYIFNLDKELGDLLVRAVDEGWEQDRFESALKLTKWVQRNAENVRKRIISRAKHNELLAAGEDVTNTEYTRDTAALRQTVQDRARTLGATLTDEQLDQVVGKIYDGFLDKDTNAITRFIAPYIGTVTSIVGTGLGTGGGQATYTGEALSDYKELQRIARANGLKLQDILPKISVPTGSTLENAVLQKLATGELDVNAIAQAARQFAAQGQPDYVRNLLGQGYDLEQVYQPYRQVMASTLELNSDQIDLNDPTLRGAITNEGDMNIYDFKRLLRKDSRWDTTENAREEVSSAVYSILRDFGFQG